MNRSPSDMRAAIEAAADQKPSQTTDTIYVPGAMFASVQGNARVTIEFATMEEARAFWLRLDIPETDKQED